ncbi:hypothetical protein HDV64DRAFT_248434 [Trichoderma sp. TUCIM 5745]
MNGDLSALFRNFKNSRFRLLAEILLSLPLSFRPLLAQGCTTQHSLGWHVAHQHHYSRLDVAHSLLAESHKLASI